MTASQKQELMFKSAEQGHKISKSVYEREILKVRQDLIQAQFQLRALNDFQVVILIGGVDGAGRGETVKTLNEWLDVRFLTTHAMRKPTKEERRPAMWKFWMALPRKGWISLFFGSWYTKPIIDYVYKDMKKAKFEEMLDTAVNFEKTLYNEGVLILKFWLHLSKKAQKKRLAALEKDPERNWKIKDIEWKHFKLYDKFRKVSAYALKKSNTTGSPWIIVEAVDKRYRMLTIGKAILSALQNKLTHHKKTIFELPYLQPTTHNKKLFNPGHSLHHVTKKNYDKALLVRQKKLNQVVAKVTKCGYSILLVFEGIDAAGKGGAIRRVAGALDPRDYCIIPIGAPNVEEKAYPYLWRFWRHIPLPGKVAIFDRSWYGRVLVERIESFCSEEDWKRAYAEINQFEEELARSKIIIIKLWLNISKKEQLKRFKEREKIKHKQFKITKEDWRNREKWEEYEIAAEEMIERTDTIFAPWIVISSDNKYYARLEILYSISQRIKLAFKTLS